MRPSGQRRLWLNAGRCITDAAQRLCGSMGGEAPEERGSALRLRSAKSLGICRGRHGRRHGGGCPDLAP
jgi:hypothetical protein